LHYLEDNKKNCTTGYLKKLETTKLVIKLSFHLYQYKGRQLKYRPRQGLLRQ